jgi:hypothetical protein
MLHAEFKVLGGKHQGRSIPINTKKFLVGREQDCHLRPNNDLVSRHHCVFLVDDFAVRLRDLGSTNGTRVNDELVRGERVLQDGDRIAIGKLELEIVIGKRAAVAAPAAAKVTAGPESSGLSGVLAVAPEVPSESEIPTDSTIEIPAGALETQSAGASGETAYEMPAYTGGYETQAAGIPGDTAILGGMPAMSPPGMMPGYGAPMGMPGYPMMPGYGAPMGYPPGYGGYPQPGYPMGMGYPMAQPMPGYPMMPQGYPGMPMAQPEAAAGPSAAAGAPVKLPDPETTGFKEPPPPPAAPAPVAGAPPAASGSDKPSNTAADIIKNYMQRRTR